ncbi:MAG: phage holin family protein [Parcubacteria group bacterium]|nr:phage holin family protein [Parcubacteria group bacterium]MCR4342404.1 phage holin family protein [Patescibacteria group bacterium]
MKILIHWLISAIAILISAYLLSGVYVDGFITAVIIAIVLGAVNGFVRPVLVVLTLPITILTLGLFLLILNTLLIMLVEVVVPGFEIDSFWWALIFGIVLSVINAILHSVSKSEVK